MVNSILDSARRVVRNGKLNTYTGLSREVADKLDIPSNSITRGTNDQRDAFRQSYSSAVMTSRYGAHVAEFFGNVNEYKNHMPSVKQVMNPDLSIKDGYAQVMAAAKGKLREFEEEKLAQRGVKSEEEWMDYYNNAKGREIATQVGARGGTEDDIKQEVAKAVTNNELVLTPFDPRRTFDERGDFERAVRESEQQIIVSWNRDLADIGNDETLSAADKQEARRRLDER